MCNGIGYRLSCSEMHALEQSNWVKAGGYALGILEYPDRETYLLDLTPAWKATVLRHQPKPHRVQPEPELDLLEVGTQFLRMLKQ